MPFDHRELDPILDSRLRVGILAMLLNGDSVDFVHMRDRLESTDGNLAKHLRKLEDAGYIKMEKSFIGRRPRTSYTITAQGRQALAHHVQALGQLIASE
jgi:DNA-binding MarR family transcriptional regulator